MPKLTQLNSLSAHNKASKKNKLYMTLMLEEKKILFLRRIQRKENLMGNKIINLLTSIKVKKGNSYYSIAISVTAEIDEKDKYAEAVEKLSRELTGYLDKITDKPCYIRIRSVRVVKDESKKEKIVENIQATLDNL